jgi:hypothetical protein
MTIPCTCNSEDNGGVSKIVFRQWVFEESANMTSAVQITAEK